MLTTLSAQTLQNGCDEAGFGIDADTRAGVSYFGNETAPVTATDDWFSGANSTGIGVLDTTGSWQFHNEIITGQNLVWLQGMSYPQNAIINGYRLYDASYARDYYGGNNATDYTSYTQASKNGEDPADWDTGPHNVLGKNDLIDCYGHLRRDGISANDHLWMYLGFSRIATSGDSYFDAELYVKPIVYNAANGFTSGGPDKGHTAWEFDAAGNIIAVGDLVATCHFSTTNAPVLGLRIWVSRFDFMHTDPMTFTFGNEFDGDGNGAVFGYADIKIPPNSLYGCGLGNQGFSPGPPWGTLNSSGNFSTFYEANQFVEVGLDLTVFGVDPLLLYTEDGDIICELPFSNILFKARASSSFTAQLKDFAGPFSFNYTTVIPANITGVDTMDCNNPIIELYATDTLPGTFYSWYTADGHIISDPSEFLISIDQPGTYILSASLAEGCEGGLDTIVVVDNMIYPIAVDITFHPNFDCNTPTHLAAHPDGYNYIWTGPNGFYATTQEVDAAVEGWYVLAVQNEASGCFIADSIYVITEPCAADNPINIPTTILIDTIPPNFTPPVDLVLDCNVDPFDLNLTGDVTDESDDCDEAIGEATFTDIISENYPCAGSAQVQRRWMLTDACGNQRIKIQIITLVDNNAPTFMPPGDITVSCEQDVDDLAVTGTVTNLVDDCDNGILQMSYADVVQSNMPCDGASVITRTWLASDDCGNTSTAVQTITQIDNVPPVFTAPQDITIACDEDPNNLSLVGEVLNEWDNCDGNIGQATYTDVVVADQPCAGAAVITRTWSLADDCGNITTQIQTITLADTEAPVLMLTDSNPPIVECDTLIPLPMIGVDLIITDNCDDDVSVVFYEQVISSACPDKFVLQRIWVATDACNNKDSIIQEYQVQDTENPIIIVLPNDITLSCSDSIPDGSPIVDDNCSEEIDISFTENIISGNCPFNYIVERTWSWMDNCGNTESHVQQITIEDNTPPTFTAPDDVTLACDQNPNDLNLTGMATLESDNCSVGLSATYADNVIDQFPCEGSSLIVRTWVLVDDCGNMTSQIQEIRLVDTLPPVFTAPANITISCESDPTDLNLTGDVMDESDNCSSAIGQATFSDSLSMDIYCYGAHVIYRTWALSDNCGNEATATQVITVEDTTPPNLVGPDDLTINCHDDPYDLSLTGQVNNFSDNCSSGVLNNMYIDSIVVSGLCAHNVTLYRTWSVSDACGNDSILVQVITIQDNTAPTFTAPQDITLECGQDPNDLLITGVVEIASDNCDANLPEATYTDIVVSDLICNGGIIINRTWELSDACGNTSSAIQQITITDITPPVFTAPEDIIIDCGTDPNDLNITGEAVNISDDCDQNIGAVTYTDDISVLGVCTGSSTIHRTWSLSDVCGNLTTALQVIHVEDTTPPVFTVPADITLECDQNPFDLSITGDVVDESDDCTINIGEAVYNDSIRIDSAICLQSITILRTWVLVDGCGNGTTAVQQINVEDSTAPVFSELPADTTIACTSLIPPLTTIQTVTDNCGATVMVVSEETTNGSGCNYTVTRTWIATDACGNTTSANQLITIMDTINPVLNTPAPIQDIACGDPLPTPENVVATDNCDSASVVFSIDPYVVDLCNSYPVTYRWIATDICGNTVEVAQSFNVLCAPPDSVQLAAEVCEGESYTVGTTTYSTAGTHVTNLQSIHGCDSIVTLELTVHPVYTLSESVNICEGESYTIGGTTYDTEGVYVVNLQSVQGCDSIITLNLTLHPVYDLFEVASLCEGESYTVGTTTYAESGTFINNLQSVHGCDSVVMLELTVYPTFSQTEVVSLCEGESYVLNNNTYTSSGTYVENLQTIHGCDSIVTLELTVHPVYALSESVNICEGESYTIGGTTYDTEGVYVVNLQSVQGCDSIITLNLTLNLVYDLFEVVSICEGDGFGAGGNIYYEAGIYTDTLQTYAGCDSIVQITLEVIPVNTFIEEASICSGGSYNYLGMEYSEAGSYSFSWVGTSGCENISTLVLTVEEPISQNMEAVICDGMSYAFGGDILENAGTYTATFSTVEGCDSIVVLQLSVQESIVTNLSVNICEGDSVLLGGAFQYQSGVFTETYTSSGNFCDSIVITQLQVMTSVVQTDMYTICQGDSMYLFNGFYQEDTSLTMTYKRYNGCDSIVTKILEVLPVVELLVEDYEICVGESVQLGVIGASEVTWSPADGLSCVDCPMPTASPSVTTSYWVTAESCMGEEVSTEVFVTVHQPPTIFITTEEDESVIRGDSVLFIATCNDPEAIISWSDSEGNALCEDCSSFVDIPFFGVTYVATAIDERGCEASDEIRFDIRNGCVEGILEIPNFITPNGDGHNDVFEIRYSNFAELSVLRIYNRWGQLVFQTKSVSSDFWNGTFRGKTLNPDVYVYYLEGKCLNGHEVIEKGNVTILK